MQSRPYSKALRKGFRLIVKHRALLTNSLRYGKRNTSYVLRGQPIARNRLNRRAASVSSYNCRFISLGLVVQWEGK